MFFILFAVKNLPVEEINLFWKNLPMSRSNSDTLKRWTGFHILKFMSTYSSSWDLFSIKSENIWRRFGKISSVSRSRYFVKLSLIYGENMFKLNLKTILFYQDWNFFRKRAKLLTRETLIYKLAISNDLINFRL